MAARKAAFAGLVRAPRAECRFWNTPLEGADCHAAASRIAVSDRSSSRARARDNDEAVLGRAVRWRAAHVSDDRRRRASPRAPSRMCIREHRPVDQGDGDQSLRRQRSSAGPVRAPLSGHPPRLRQRCSGVCARSPASMRAAATRVETRVYRYLSPTCRHTPVPANWVLSLERAVLSVPRRLKSDGLLAAQQCQRADQDGSEHEADGFLEVEEVREPRSVVIDISETLVRFDKWQRVLKAVP